MSEIYNVSKIAKKLIEPNSQVSCPGATRDTAGRKAEDMLAGIPWTTAHVTSLRTEGTFSSAEDKCSFWSAPSVVTRGLINYVIQLKVIFYFHCLLDRGQFTIEGG